MNGKEMTENNESLAQNIEGFLQKIVAEQNVTKTAEKPEVATVGRKKVLPALALWGGVVIGVLRGFTSQAQIWRLVSWQGVWNYPASNVSDQAVYNRLAEAGDQTLQKLFIQVRDGLRTYLIPYEQKNIAPFASGVFAIDGSTLDKMARLLPSLRTIPNGDSRLLPGKMVGLFDIRLQQWRDIIHLTNPNQNDKVAARQLVKELPKGSLILADLGFFAFAWFDQLTQWKLWWVTRMRKKVTYEVLHTYYSNGEELFDGVVWLGNYRADKAAHAVRLVTFDINGKSFRYITNVLDPNQLSLHDIAVLYARRWDIELAFKTLKHHLNLHLIWSGKPTIILQQLWATLIIAQVFHAIQLEIAGLAQVDPFDVSLDLLARYVPTLAYEGKDPVQMIVADGRRMGFIRPSRRIRPKTPDVSQYTLLPLPENMTLKRAHRYANRRGPADDADPIGVIQASSLEPVFC